MTKTMDASARTILNLIEAAGYPTLDTLPPPGARQAADASFAMLQSPKAEVAEVRELLAQTSADDIPLRLYRPLGSQSRTPLPALIYFHGGGFVIGNIGMYDSLCRQLCNASGCVVISVEYRLAPDSKFPAAAEDCFAATQWIAANATSLGIDAKRLAVGGDSAGGNLAAVTCLMARDAGAPNLRHQVLIYPVTDVNGNTDSYRANGQGYFLTEPLMTYFMDHYLRSPADKNDWRASPLLASNHAGLPPALVLVCGFDPLLDDGVSYADKLNAAGVPVILRRFDGQIHGFLSMDGAIPEAQVAIKEIGASLRQALN